MQRPPVVYQETPGGERLSVEGSYVLAGSGQVAFRVGAYDPTRPLIIDPVIIYLGDLPPGTSPLSKLDLGPFEVHSMV